MKIAKSIKTFQYRTNLRKTLLKEPYDLLKITYEETKKNLKEDKKANETA